MNSSRQKVLRVARRTLIPGLALLFGILTVIASMLNAFAVDVLSQEFAKTRIQGYILESDEVSGGLFGGFLISGVRLLERETRQEVLAVDTAFVRLSLTRLLQGELEVGWARIDRMRVSSKGLQRLFVQKDLREAFRGDTGSFLDSLTVRDVHFYELSLDSPLTLFLSEDQILDVESVLQPNLAPRFSGSLNWMKQQLFLNASLGQEEHKDKMEMDFQLNTRSMKGHVSFKADSYPVDNLLKLEHPIEGAFAFNTRFDFAAEPEQLTNPKRLQLPNSDFLFYTLQGRIEGQIGMLSLGPLVASDLQILGEWTHENAFLRRAAMDILGTQILASGSWSSQSTPVLSVVVPGVELPEMLHALGYVEQARNVEGNLVASLQMQGGDWEVTGFRLDRLKIYGQEVQCSELQFLNFQEYIAGLDQKLHFRVKEIGSAGITRASLAGVLQPGMIEFTVNSPEIDLKSVPYFPLSTWIDASFSAHTLFQVDLKQASIQFNSKARSGIMRWRGAELKNVNLETEGSLNDFSVRGSALFQDKSDVYIDAVVRPERANVEIRSPAWDMAFMQQFVPELELIGLMRDTRIDCELWPEQRLSAQGQADRALLFGIPLQDVQIDMAQTARKLWVKILDRQLRLQISSTDGDVDFSLNEKNLSRLLAPFLPMHFVELQGGEVQMDGRVRGDHSRLAIKRLQLGVGDNHLSLTRESQLEFGKDKALSGKLELGLTQGSNSRNANLALELKPEGFALQIKGLKSQTLTTAVLSDMNLELSYLQGIKGSEPTVMTTLDLQNVNVTLAGVPMFLDEVLVRAEGRDRLIHLKDFYFRRLSSSLKSQGTLPLTYTEVQSELFKSTWSMRPTLNLTGPLNLQVQSNGFDLRLLKPLLSKFLTRLSGEFHTNMEVSGTLEQPRFLGPLEVRSGELMAKTPYGIHGAEKLHLFSQFSQGGIRVQTLQFDSLGARVNLTGNVLLLEGPRVDLAGSMQRAAVMTQVLVLDSPMISNLKLQGTTSDLLLSGDLEYREALIGYDDLIYWANSVKGMRQEGVPDWLKVKLGLNRPGGRTILRSDIFHLEVQPQLHMSLNGSGIHLDGQVVVQKGRLNLARQRFDVEPGSNLKFTSSESLESGKSKSLWDSRQFRRASVADKLGLMWQEGQDSRASSMMTTEFPFPGILNLRASSRSLEANLELSVSGPIGDVRPVLIADGRRLATEEWMKYLAPGKLVSQPAQIKRLSEEEEAELLSSQVANTIENQLLGRHFEGLLGELFNLRSFQVQSSMLAPSAGVADSQKLRLGTSLSDTVDLTHEQETSRGGLVRNRTQLEFHVNDKTDLILQRSREAERDAFDFDSVKESDFQFGFRRKIKF